MLFESFEVKGLAHYSYLVGCPAAGIVAVVDPRRDVDVYLSFAADRGLRISHVLETHIHADFASGARALAAETGAELCLSGHDDGEVYQVGFQHRDLRDGERIQLGSVSLQALHTPGHTPEHLSFLVYDANRSEETPMMMLSGDFLFVGSLGRPDLLGEEAKLGLAQQLFRSVKEKLAGLPDGLEIYPAHGAGSMCGAGMSGRPHSTLGFEKVANPYLDAALDRDRFLEMILTNVPPLPDYYRRMKELNSAGPPLLNPCPSSNPLPAERFHSLVEAGHLVIDLRSQVDFGRAHIPAAFGIGSGDGLSTWASWVVPYGHPLLLVGDSAQQAVEAVRSLVRVGLDDVVGYLEGGIAAWIERGFPLQETTQMTPAALNRCLESGQDIFLMDVRSDAEWTAGHIDRAVHVMAGHLPERLGEIPRHRRIAVVCASGYRSTVAAGVLERAGFAPVNVTGGMQAWCGEGLPVVEPTLVAPVGEQPVVDDRQESPSPES